MSDAPKPPACQCDDSWHDWNPANGCPPKRPAAPPAYPWQAGSYDEPAAPPACDCDELRSSPELDKHRVSCPAPPPADVAKLFATTGDQAIASADLDPTTNPFCRAPAERATKDLESGPGRGGIRNQGTADPLGATIRQGGRPFESAPASGLSPFSSPRADDLDALLDLLDMGADSHPLGPSSREPLRRAAAAIRTLRAERDEAIAHDRQPYPTAEAYERVCAALEKKRHDLDAARAEVEEHRAAATTATRLLMERNHDLDAALAEVEALTLGRDEYKRLLKVEHAEVERLLVKLRAAEHTHCAHYPDCCTGRERAEAERDELRALALELAGALADTLETVACQCEEAYTGRGLHAPECKADEVDLGRAALARAKEVLGE